MYFEYERQKFRGAPQERSVFFVSDQDDPTDATRQSKQIDDRRLYRPSKEESRFRIHRKVSCEPTRTWIRFPRRFRWLTQMYSSIARFMHFVNFFLVTGYFTRIAARLYSPGTEGEWLHSLEVSFANMYPSTRFFCVDLFQYSETRIHQRRLFDFKSTVMSERVFQIKISKHLSLNMLQRS